MWKGFIEWFIHGRDRLDPDSYRRAQFFVISFLIFFAGCFLGQIFIILGNFPMDIVIGNGIMTVLIPTALFLYRRFGGRIVIVNVVSVMGYMSNVGTYDFSGGIYSSDLASGIIISAWIYLVANRISGLFWFGVTLLSITFFYYAEIHGFKDFRGDVMKLAPEYHFFNYIFILLFLLLVIHLYDSGKESFLKMLRSTLSDINRKNAQLELFKQDTEASISYARRIQLAVLPQEEAIYRAIPLSFIFYRPKDIVSGDFFWFHRIDGARYVLALADCTGHGVPGAFMTVIGSSLLNQVIVEGNCFDPAAILETLDEKLVQMLKQEKQRYANVPDGMDISIIYVDLGQNRLFFSSAKRPMLFVRDGLLQEFKGSKHSIGGIRSGEKVFEEFEITFREDDQFYFYSDGFTDQFGGDKGKKYSSRRFKEKIQSLHLLPMQLQAKEIEREFESWKGGLEQVDDVCVMGIRF